MKKLTNLLVAVFMLLSTSLFAQQTIEVATLAEFAKAIAKDNQNIKLAQGRYKMIDYINADSVKQRVARKDYQYIVFSGNNNTIDMTGVVFEVDTKLRALLKHPIHTDEITVEGNNNKLKGLEIQHIGNTTSSGGCAFTVKGTYNTIEAFTLHVQGSSPYGYGDLFGKGKDHVIKHKKHSGFLINGEGTTVINCKLYMKSFGHGFFIQKKPSNVTLIDCYVEGEVRKTDEILAETSGAAYDVKFRTLNKNRNGEYVVTPGYTKALCEEGFRTYGACKNLKFINCTAKHTRGGFELRSNDESIYLENCTTIGTERAYWVGEGAIVKGCKGDASNGPLLFVEGNSCDIELEVMPNESGSMVHALATIHGNNNRIVLNPYKGENRSGDVAIMLGYSQPSAGEPMSPFGQRSCANLKLTNNTTMSVVVGKECVDYDVESKGKVVKE
ncbi:MAG: hypothetical protein SNG27_05990 [Rikenellaceae bacterium]